MPTSNDAGNFTAREREVEANRPTSITLTGLAAASVRFQFPATDTTDGDIKERQVGTAPGVREYTRRRLLEARMRA